MMKRILIVIAAAFFVAPMAGGGSVSAQTSDTCPISYSMEYGTCEGHATGTPPVAAIAPLTTVAVVGQHWNCARNGEATIVTTAQLRTCDDPDNFSAYNYPDGHTVRHEDDEGNFSHYTQEYLQPLETTQPVPPGQGPDRTDNGTSVKEAPRPLEPGACPLWYSMQHRTCDGHRP